MIRILKQQYDTYLWLGRMRKRSSYFYQAERLYQLLNVELEKVGMQAIRQHRRL